MELEGIGYSALWMMRAGWSLRVSYLNEGFWNVCFAVNVWVCCFVCSRKINVEALMIWPVGIERSRAKEDLMASI